MTTAGTYHVTVSGSQSATSDTFQIASASSLYGPLVGDGVNFFENQRDGGDLVSGSTIARKASHLNDASATVYKDPTFIAGSDGGTGDQISGSLSKVSGASAVNVEGGWFDAGDYLKFTFTTAYADDLLYAADLALGSSAPAVADHRGAVRHHVPEQDVELRRPRRSTSRSASARATRRTTSATTTCGASRRPTTRTPPPRTTTPPRTGRCSRPPSPGAKISPDVVGRVAAAFAFAAQQDEAAGNTSGAQTELADATSLYAMADTSAAENDSLTSALPEAYYPEAIWHDAMELGATEIVRAEQALGNSESSYSSYLTQAATWASDYISADSGNDTLNLYDVSALAHADLVAAINGRGQPVRPGRQRLRPDRQPQGPAVRRREQGGLGHLPRGRRLHELRRGLAHLRLHLDRGAVPEGEWRHAVRGLRE